MPPRGCRDFCEQTIRRSNLWARAGKEGEARRLGRNKRMTHGLGLSIISYDLYVIYKWEEVGSFKRVLIIG